jgi:hypothetical protein
MSRAAKLKNSFYNLLSNDRHCSNCKNSEQRLGLVDQVLIAQHRPLWRDPKYNICCTIDNLAIIDEKKSCARFQRRYGYSPARQRLINFKRWVTFQWECHKEIIELIVAITAIIITILLAKGLI